MATVDTQTRGQPVLRLTDPLLDGPLGGWSPLRARSDRAPRVVTADQRWSLAIVLTAALVAMGAIIFDIRLPAAADAASLPVVLPAASTESATAPAAATATDSQQTPGGQATVPADTAPPPTPTAEFRLATAAPPTEPAAERTPAAAPTAADSAPQPSSAAVSKQTAIDSPAARIRNYLGLHPGAQLPVSFVYSVEAGDTASSIAARFGLDEATVLFNNFDIYDPDNLAVDQRLTLPPVDGLVYTVQPGDAFSSLMHNFQADEALTVAWPSNGISSPGQIDAGQTLLLVQGSASVASSAPSATSVSAGSSGTWSLPVFRWPLSFDKISDPFGTPRGNAVGYHTGVDFITAVGTIVGSTATGQVTVATWDPSYGNWIEIDHGGGFRSRYAHLNEIWVREGEWVEANAYVGTVGSTGNSSGAHLHFEIIVDGQAVEPLQWLE